MLLNTKVLKSQYKHLYYSLKSVAWLRFFLKYVMATVTEIEQSLGKDRFRNVHWKPKIPTAFEIISRKNDLKLATPDYVNKTVTLGGIDYTHNNLGYRSHYDYNLSHKNVILVLGDSDAFGTGVEYNAIYPTLLQSLSEYTILNLGVPGTSGDGMTRIGCQTMLALGNEVKHVCVLWPVASLREFVSRSYKAGIHTLSTDLPYDDWWKHIDWVSNNYNYQKNKLLLQSVTENIGAKFHDLMINRYDETSPVEYIQSGQFTEFSPKTHTAIANYYIKRITDK